MVLESAPWFTELSLSNWRGFKKEPLIPLAPLTILVGPNSSGKSSVSDALLLLGQSEFHTLWLAEPAWAGSLIDLGSYEDSVYKHRKSYRIRIGVRGTYMPGHKSRSPSASQVKLPKQEYELSAPVSSPNGRLRRVLLHDPISGRVAKVDLSDRKGVHIRVAFEGFKESLDVTLGSSSAGIEGYGPLRWRLGTATDGLVESLADRLWKLHGTKARGIKAAAKRLAGCWAGGPIEYLCMGMQRVASGRSGPQRWYPVIGRSQRHVRFATRYSKYGPTDSRSKFDGVNLEGTTPRTKATLARYLERLDIATDINLRKLSQYHTSIDVRDSRTKVLSNLQDVGYGTSQILPVFEAIASKSRGPLLIEQPEIHLHPRAQGEVGDLLCETSRRRQVIVETHSEHVVNRARLMVADGRLRPADVMILYVDRSHKGSRVLPIPLGERGQFLAEWPSGFFDERYHDTLKLMRLEKKGSGTERGGEKRGRRS